MSLLNQPCNLTVVAPNGEPSALFKYLKENRPDTHMADYSYLAEISPYFPQTEQGELDIEAGLMILDATQDIRRGKAYSNELIEALVNQGEYATDKYGNKKYSLRNIERARRSLLVADLMPGYLPNLANLRKLVPINSADDAIELLKAYAKGEIKEPKKLVNTLQQMHDKALSNLKRKLKGKVIEEDINVLMKIGEFEAAGGLTDTTGQPQDSEQYVGFMNGLNGMTTGFRRSSASRFFKKMKAISPHAERAWKKYINTIGTDVLSKDTLEGMALGATTAAIHSHDNNIDLYLPDRHGTVTQLRVEKSRKGDDSFMELTSFDYPKLSRLNSTEKRGAFIASSFLRFARMQGANVALFEEDFEDPLKSMLGTIAPTKVIWKGRNKIAVNLDDRFIVPPYDLGWRYKGSYIDPVFHQLASELPRDRAELIHDIISQPEFKRRHGHWDLYQKLQDGDSLSSREVEILKGYEPNELADRVGRFYKDGGTIDIPKVQELLMDPTKIYRAPKPVRITDAEWTNKFVTRVGMQEVINRLQNSFPNLVIKIENDPNLPYSGKFNGEIYINIANANIDTPFHEYGHAWLSMIELENPSEYADLIATAKAMPAYSSKKSKLGLTDDDTAQEVLADMIGAYGQRKVRSSFLDRLMQTISDIWYRTMGFVISPREARLHNLISGLVLDMSQGSIINPNISSEMLKSVVSGAMYKMVPSKFIVDEKTNLIELISGDISATRKKKAILRAERLLQKEYNKPENAIVDGKRVVFKSDADKRRFDKDDSDSTTYWTNFGSVDAITLKATIAELIEKQQGERTEEMIKTIRDHFKKSYEIRAQERREDTPRGKALSKLFPDFRNYLNDENLNSKVVRYKLEELESVGLGHLYTPELDSEDIVLAVHKGRKNGKYHRWIDIAILSPEHVSSKITKTESLYDRGLFGRPEAIGKNGLSLVNTAYGRGALKAGLLALHFQNKGEKVHRMSVSKVSQSFIASDDDRTVLIPAGNVLPEIQDLFRSDTMKALAKQSERANKPFLKELAYNDNFEVDQSKFKIEDYYRSYIDQLIDFYDNQRAQEGMPLLMHGYETGKAAQKYLYGQNKHDLHSLIRAAETQLNRIKEKKQDNESNPEFLMLAGLLQELQSPVHRGYTKIADMDFLDKYTTAVNGVTDPYLAWWIRQWKTAKINLAKELQPEIRENAKAYEAVRKDFYTKNPVEGATESIYSVEERVFRSLIKTKQIELNGEAIEINTHRLLTKKDEEWASLSDEQKKYIDFVRNKIKTAFVDWYKLTRLDSEEDAEERALQAYDNTVYAEGYLPPMKASPEEMRNRAADGGGINAYRDSFSRWWDLQSGDVRYVDADRDLNDLPVYLLERGMSKSGYFEYLGLNEEGDPLDDIETFRARQTEMSDNIVDMLNRFQLQQLQHKNMRHLLTAWKASRALIASSADDVNVVAQTGNTTPANLQFLDALVQKVLFGKEISLGESPLARKATAYLAALAGSTSIAFLGFNFVANIANFSSVFTNLAVQQLMEERKEERPTKEKATGIATSFLSDYTKDPAKMYTIARRVGVVQFDPYEAINSRRLTGKPKSVMDMRNLYVVDQMGDELMRIFHMYYHMKKDGVWDSWVWDSETEELIYDYNKDKREKAVKDLVEENIQKEIYKNPDMQNKYSPYDVNLILRLERKISRKVGGYKEGDQTMAGMYTIGRAATQFRRYMMMHVENARKTRTVNPNSVSYRADNGNALVVADEEEGHFNTLGKVYNRLRELDKMSMSEIKQVLKDPVEIENISKMIAYTLVSALATMAYIAFAAEDDEEINVWSGKSNKWDGFWTRMYHALQGEMNMLNLLQSKSLVFTNPLTFTALITFSLKLIEDLQTGDYEKLGDDVTKKIGAVKILAEVTENE